MFPASDLSEQISTAGTEASGTGNMKFSINGALTIGTLDGANIEIREEVGEENFFIFGLTAEQVFQRKSSGYNPPEYINKDPRLMAIIDLFRTGYFSPEDANCSLRYWMEFFTGMNFMLMADFSDYVACQQKVSELYRNPDPWTRMAVLNVARMAKFSSIAPYTSTTGIFGTRIRFPFPWTTKGRLSEISQELNERRHHYLERFGTILFARDIGHMCGQVEDIADLFP